MKIIFIILFFISFATYGQVQQRRFAIFSLSKNEINKDNNDYWDIRSDEATSSIEGLVLKGNVLFENEQNRVRCDSAVVKYGATFFHAFGNVYYTNVKTGLVYAHQLEYLENNFLYGFKADIVTIDGKQLL